MRGLMAFRQQLSNKVDRARGERQIASTGSPSNNCIGCGSDQLQRNGPYDAFGGHARGGLQMNRTLTKWAAAGALSLCTAIPALAGSVTQPGETVGLNAGAPLPPGWYAINTVDWGCRKHQPAAHMYGSHHSGRRLVNAVDVLGREIPVAGGVARGGSRRDTRPRPRFARHLLCRYVQPGGVRPIGLGPRLWMGL